MSQSRAWHHDLSVLPGKSSSVQSALSFNTIFYISIATIFFLISLTPSIQSIIPTHHLFNIKMHLMFIHAIAQLHNFNIAFQTEYWHENWSYWKNNHFFIINEITMNWNYNLSDGNVKAYSILQFNKKYTFFIVHHRLWREIFFQYFRRLIEFVD